MKLDVVANSGNDEFYTPAYAVYPIIQYIPQGSIIWCPFDTSESNFVKVLRSHGFQVIHTHKDQDGDFFTTLPENFDIIISNPPYSLKYEVLSRLFSLGKPFAMLIGVVGIFESQKRFNMFKDNDFEVMYFNKRVAYFKDFNEQKPSLNPPFSSAYFCSKLLPKSMVFAEISK